MMDDERIEGRVRDLYRDTPRPPADAVERAMRAVHSGRAPRHQNRRRPQWLGIAGLVAAAAVVFFFAGMAVDRRMKRTISPSQTVAAALPIATADSSHDITFVLAAPSAHDVALVGDFNGWDRTGTKLTRDSVGQWRIRLRVAPGLHVYAFVIDGSTWTVDPLAPRSADDGYGVTSTILVPAPSASVRSTPRS